MKKGRIYVTLIRYQENKPNLQVFLLKRPKLIKWANFLCLVFDLSSGISPGVGLNPYKLQYAAGFLHEPIMSEPSAIGIKSAAIEAAAPPLEPPAVFETS